MNTNKRSDVIKLILWAFVFISLTGCQSSLFSYQGRTAKPENRIDLKEGGPYRGFYQTRDIAIDYEYVNRADSFQLSGTVQFDNSLRYNFNTVENFSLQLNFLGSDGKVIEMTWLARSAYRQQIDNLPFSRILALPVGATGLAFSYSGKAREGGGGGGGDEVPNGGDTWDFWMTP